MCFLKRFLKETNGLLQKVAGHSLRVTEAQGLAKLGLDTWAIQLLGRWGSGRVRGYIREVQLERSSLWATEASKRIELETLVHKILESNPRDESVTDPRSAGGRLDRGNASAGVDQRTRTGLPKGLNRPRGKRSRSPIRQRRIGARPP